MTDTKRQHEIKSEQNSNESDPIIEYCHPTETSNCHPTDMDTTQMIFNESMTSMSNGDDEEAANHEHLDGIDEYETQQINELDTSAMMPCSLDTLPLPTVSDFADLAEPFYSAIKQDVLEDSSSDLLEQVDIGDRNFFDQPQSEMEMENTPEPHNFVTIHDWDFSMGGRIQIDNSSDQESAISGSPTENITEFIHQLSTVMEAEEMKTEARTLNTSHHQTQPNQHQIRSAPIEIRIPQYRAVYSQNGDKYLLNNIPNQGNYVIATLGKMRGPIGKLSFT